MIVPQTPSPRGFFSSNSPADVEPVFDAIVENAGRLCDAVYCVVYRFDGVLVHVAAHRNMNAAILVELQRHYPRALDGMTVVGRSILDRRPFQVEDARGPQAPPMSVVFAERLGYRTLLSVPMLREGLPIGAIALARQEARLFTEAELELVQTFADLAWVRIKASSTTRSIGTRRPRLLGRTLPRDIQSRSDPSLTSV